MSNLNNKIIIIPNHYENYKILKAQFFSNCLHFDWTKYQKQLEDFNYGKLKDIFNNWIKENRVDLAKTILILDGEIGLFLYELFKQYEIHKIILINVPLAQTMINPFTMAKSSYKKTENHFYLQLGKLSLQYQDILTEKEILKAYKYYENSYTFINKVYEYMNYFLNLRKFKQQNFANNVYFILGDKNNFIKINKQIRYLKKLNVKYEIIKNASYFLMLDQKENFNNILNKVINQENNE